MFTLLEMAKDIPENTLVPAIEEFSVPLDSKTIVTILIQQVV